jgi:cobaltochelatase CobT
MSASIPPEQLLEACARALAGGVPPSEARPAPWGVGTDQGSPGDGRGALAVDPHAPDWTLQRAAADARAMRQRFGSPESGAEDDPLGALLHAVRRGALGARDYPGIGVNLMAASATQPVWRGALLRCAWRRLNGVPPGERCTLARLDPPWEERFSGGLEGYWGLLRRHLDDPAAFARALQRLLPLLHQRLAAQGIDPLARPTPAASSARASLQGRVDRAQPTTDQQPLPIDSPDAVDRPEQASVAPVDAGRDHSPEEAVPAGDDTAAPGVQSVTQPPGPLSDYRVVSRARDQVIEARRLLPPAELVRLRSHLDASLAELPPIAHRLAARLQRRLQTLSLRQWAFDRDEGLIDSARLAPFIAAPRSQRLFKQEQDAPFRGAAVTLLVDNSGSMKGPRILLAVLCTELLAKALERCGLAVEILGFTTRDLLDGPPQDRERPMAAPSVPGRLNATRHLIYKSATTPWRRARTGLAAMLHEPLLKENVDGEALLWAHARLLRRPEAQRILLVISDGAPMDRATAAANGRAYLERHLFQVADWIERRSPVDLVAIGIGHDVGRFYRRAVTIARPEQLAEVLIERLTAVLLNAEASGPGRRP